MLYYLSTFERTFYFSLVAAIIMGLLCKWKKQPLIAGNLKLIGMRSLFGYLSTVLLFLAATQTYPVANISLLSSTSTIFALLAAVIWLKEHMARGQVLSVLHRLCRHPPHPAADRRLYRSGITGWIGRRFFCRTGLYGCQKAEG